jgi:putative addiction module component (TIGR02574 family)
MTQVLELPRDEREELLRALLQSFEEPGEDEGHVAAWDAEIERRAQDGDDAFEDVSSAMRSIRDEILGQ